MKMCGRYIFSIVIVFLSGCSLSEEGAPSISVFSASFDFDLAPDGWQADFADMPSVLEDTSLYKLKFEHTDLPSNLGTGKSLMLSGNNHGDDLFLFIKRKITGLMPNTSYNLVFEVQLASNIAADSVNAGGYSGNSIFLKAGASGIEPKRVAHADKYVLNIDKGERNSAGDNAVVLGDISIPSSSTDYQLISRSNASSVGHQPFIAQSNDAGEIWLVVGTDSGLTGITTVYYTKVNVVFSASN
jgi:hypothetical protein